MGNVLLDVRNLAKFELSKTANRIHLEKWLIRENLSYFRETYIGNVLILTVSESPDFG